MTDSLAVHGVAYPSDRVAGRLDSMDMARKVILYLKPVKASKTMLKRTPVESR